MTTAVVCAAFDPAADRAVDLLRERVEAAGYRARRNHRPHLTLAAARVADVDTVVAAARVVAARHQAIPLRMRGLQVLRGDVLFVAPEESDRLGALQRDVHDTLIAAGWPSAFGARSDPAQWVPHCTVATGLARPAIRQLLRLPVPSFPATVEALTVIVVGGRGDIAQLPLGSAPPGARITP